MQISRSNLDTKGAKLSLEVESDEGDVEDLRRYTSDDAAEERLPAERLGPEWRQVFHGEQKTADRRVEPCRHPGSHASRRELSPIQIIYITILGSPYLFWGHFQGIGRD